MIVLPFSFAGVLQYTPYSGAQPVSIPVNASGSFSSRSDDKYEILGAQTKAVDFGSSPGAGCKVLLIVYVQGTAPIMVKVNGSVTGEEIVQGGSRFYVNPVPAAGITAASITTTADATVLAIVLG